MDKLDIVKYEKEQQTDIGAEFFDEKGSQMSMHSKNRLNQDSSTAFGTIQPNHGASMMIDVDGKGLAHNQSIDAQGDSPGMRSSGRRMGVVNEEDDYYNEQPMGKSSSRKKSKMSSGAAPSRGGGMSSMKSVKKGSVGSPSGRHEQSHSKFSKKQYDDDYGEEQEESYGDVDMS
jgi:hypothetical protein